MIGQWTSACGRQARTDPQAASFPHLQEQLTAATAAMVTQGNIEAEEEAARKKAEREAKKKAQEEEEERRKKAEEEARLVGGAIAGVERGVGGPFGSCSAA